MGLFTQEQEEEEEEADAAPFQQAEAELHANRGKTAREGFTN